MVLGETGLIENGLHGMDGKVEYWESNLNGCDSYSGILVQTP